ncbi:MAG: hypothetical protein IMW99_04430 [Firmicutes bacterium]|nr:hypothetical protein [Bacillota bacterium]
MAGKKRNLRSQPGKARPQGSAPRGSVPRGEPVQQAPALAQVPGRVGHRFRALDSGGYLYEIADQIGMRPEADPRAHAHRRRRLQQTDRSPGPGPLAGACGIPGEENKG